MPQADKHQAPTGPPRRTARAALRHALALSVVSLVLHGLFLVEDRHNPTMWRPVIDAEEYDRMAREIASGQWTPLQPYWHPPLYPYCLAAVYALSGGEFVTTKIVHTLVGTATCLLSWWLGRRLFGETVGLLAGLLLACWGPLIFFNTQMLATGLSVFLNLLVVYLLMRALEQPTSHRWLLAGVSMGLAALALPNILVLLPLLVAWLIAVGIRRWSPRVPTYAGLCLLGTVAAIAPVTIRNYVVSGQFVPISVNGGINLHVGNNPDSFHTIGFRPDRKWSQLRREPELGGARTWREADEYFYRKVLTYIRAQPGDFLEGLLRKARLFWNAREIPRNVDLYMFRDYSRVLSILTWRWGSIGCPFGLMTPLAVLGAIIACRSDKRSWLLAAYVAAYSGSVILFFVSARHRLPIVPVIAIFAACGLSWLVRRLRDRRFRSAACAGALVVFTGVLVNWPVRAPTDGVNFPAELHYFLGTRAIRARHLEMAIRQLHKAIEIDPSYPEANFKLGQLLLDEGQHKAAARHLNRALALAPDYAQAYHGLGLLAVIEKRWPDAAQHFRDALDLMPVLHDSRYRLGMALVRQGKTAEAAEQFRTAIQLGATDPTFCRALRDKCGKQAQAPSGSQPVK